MLTLNSPFSLLPFVQKSSFRDRVRLHVSGGRGGTGCSSYDRDPYGKGGPDGANGGRGGDVFLVASEALSMLGFDSFHLRAQNGQAGGSNRSKGRNGHSLHVPVPAGTVVSEILATDPSSGEYRLRFLADLDRHGLMLQVARGGSGGLGNRAFRTEYRKQARFSTVGRPGEARWLWLELKCIADVGLVGYPKSALKQQQQTQLASALYQPLILTGIALSFCFFLSAQRRQIIFPCRRIKRHA